MPRVQNIYNIYKITSTFICENDYNIKSYTKKQAIADGGLVGIGDSILLDRLRFLKGDNRDPKTIFNDIQNYRATLKRCKKEGKIKEAKILNQFLTDTLFVKDIVVVQVDRKSDYRKIARNGFVLNGMHFVRLSASAGQLRRNCSMFVNEEYFERLYKMLMCGIDEKVKEMNIGKLTAYFALTTSSILWVDTPRVCVVKDFETIIKNQKVDWIAKDDNGVGYVEERVLDIPLNSADGQGLIDPKWADHWAANMELDYTPSSFVTRSAFVKGNLVPFDFREYAHRNNIDRIYDRWGRSYNIDEIDVILSESQFKMYKYYSSWQEYLDYVNKYGIKWGVARYNRKYDDDWTLANYQHIQVLSLNKEDIHGMISPTIEWLKNICSGEKLYALLYLFGGFDADSTFSDVQDRAQSLAMRAVVRNQDFLQDTYIQRKIYRNIVESINQAKIGKIWTRGNFSLMISDPIAQCRSALGLDPVGEIPADHVYSNFWNERQYKGEIFIARNPCIDAHELNPCWSYRSEEADYWYQYIKSGIIFSIYDTSTMRLSDADFDGDVCYNTDNPYFLKGASKYVTNVISYDKVAAPLHKINHRNYVESDIRSFGSRVGVYSNYATIIETMKGLFTSSTQEWQRGELQRRKKLLREIVGAEIDSGKGLAKPKVPPEFTHFETVNKDDDDIIKAEKYKHNSLVISKKPYFFRYLYPELNKKYKQYERTYNDISKCSFGIKFKKLLVKKDKTENELTLIRRYHKFSPLISSECTMNLLCREFEDVDFEIQYDKKSVNMLPSFEGEFETDEEIFNKIKKLYHKYNNRKASTFITNYFEQNSTDNEFDVNDIKFSLMDTILEDIRIEFEEMNLSSKEFLFYTNILSKKYTKFNWGFAWEVLGDKILELIEQKDIEIPVENEEGREYLGRKYILKKISVKEEEEKYDR